MSSPRVKLTAFAAALAVIFGCAAVAGSAIGPEPKTAPAGTDHMAMGAGGHEAAHDVRGLAVAADGLRLVVDDAEFRRGETKALRFEIVDDEGAVVRDFDVEHTKRLHLIIARRDLTGFQHLHPVQAADGSWSTDVRLPAPGTYRMFADVVHDGEPVTLADDLRVDGDAEFADLPAPALSADAGGGYEVERGLPTAIAGEATDLHFDVHHNGQPVTVEPYLGANGHLVALREGDLAFLHVHPTEGAGSLDGIGFEATFPTPGRYRLFLQFQHERRVHTAAFTQVVK